MIITSARSSSYITHDWCPHKFYITYVLGGKEKTNAAAVRGNVLHKALEFLAQKKLAIQENRDSFKDDGIGEIKIDVIDENSALLLAFDYYTVNTCDIKLTDKDLKECKKLFQKALEYKDGLFNPLNANIVSPERKFSFEIKEDWAKYNYKLKGETLEGYLVLNGTIDLVVEIDQNTYEVKDYKSGLPWKDWSKDKTKDYDSLMEDTQLLMYYYAAKTLYPDKNIVMTIYYLKDKEMTLFYSDNEYKRAKEMIRTKFENIKNCQIPYQNFTWKCKQFCPYNKQYGNTNKTICEYLHDQVVKNGMEATTDKFIRPNFRIGAYLEGGGRKENVDKSPT